MPYEGEFATYRSIRRLIEEKRVKDLLDRMKKNDFSQDRTTLPRMHIQDLSPSEWQPDFVLAVDGSYQETSVENGYPGAAVGYVTTASVLMHLAKIRELDLQRPINPKLFRETEKVTSIDSVFPGCNVIIDTERVSKDSLRKVLFETFDTTHLFTDGESFLDTYEALLKYRPEDPKPDCPYAENGRCSAEDKKYLRGIGAYCCECKNANTLYSTDALRIHERMVFDGANGQMFGEIMQVLERIIVIHILRWFEQKQLLWLLGNMAIVVDGPLAVYGAPAWLHSVILDELRRINEVSQQFTDGQDLLMIGIEKTGNFVDHFEKLDEDKHGVLGAFPSQSFCLLSDEYIKQNITISNSEKPYGDNTYFGRKFFYKTASGARLVASLPFLDESHRDLTRADADQYPRLADALSLLDQLVSSRYPNSVSPLISAHAEAAIPMNLGSRVLENEARRLIQERQ